MCVILFLLIGLFFLFFILKNKEQEIETNRYYPVIIEAERTYAGASYAQNRGTTLFSARHCFKKEESSIGGTALLSVTEQHNPRDSAIEMQITMHVEEGVAIKKFSLMDAEPEEVIFDRFVTLYPAVMQRGKQYSDKDAFVVVNQQGAPLYHGEGSFSSQFVGWSDVDVPFGRFRCAYVKVTEKYTVDNETEVLKSDVYLLDGVGMVKERKVRVLYWKDGTSDEDVTTYELQTVSSACPAGTL
jgi:hypothetical protein